jgi:hypothetical protein
LRYHLHLSIPNLTNVILGIIISNTINILNKLNILISLLLLLSIFFFLNCSYNAVSPQENPDVTPKTVGILYKPNGVYAANTLICFIEVDAIALPGSQVPVDSVYADSIGRYTVSTLRDGEYNAFGDNDGDLSFRAGIRIKNGVADQDTLRDTLKQAGSLCCFVKHRYHSDSRFIIGLVPGTMYCLQPEDSTGIFTLTNLAQGTYQVRFVSALSYYAAFDTSFVIRSGVNDTLSDTMCLEYGGIPKVTAFTASYDNRSNIVNLSWRRMDTLLVPAYNIYKAEAGQELQLLTQSPVTDTFFTDSSLTLWTTCNYCITGYRNGENGPFCEVKTIEVIFKPQGWYKGQLHCHTASSDGALPVSQAIQMYRDAGYDFVAVSDHNMVTPTDQYSDTDFVTIPNDEFTYGAKHVNAINAVQHYPGSIPDPVQLQDVIDAALSVGAIPHINHPESAGHTAMDVFTSTGAYLLEIVNHRYGGLEYNLALWDDALSWGKQMYATAADDAHNYKTDFNLGWIMVKAPYLTNYDILAAIEAGEFYASTGPVITEISKEGRTLSIVSVDGITIDFIGKNGEVLASVDSSSASYTLPAGELYVRAEVTNARGKVAYTQAYFP